ncbi:MAG: hypothetical protein K5639_03925 [Eubacterium sp.]|nr:hypothetical protein [Eubacterium sp.]
MNFIDKLERRFPRFGIPGLMKYIICLSIVGTVIALIDISGILPVNIYAQYLSLDVYQILHGQVWRLVTFILYPTIKFYGNMSSSMVFIDLIWFAIWAFLYYQIGTVLEREWGKFRFTLFYIGGVLFVIIVSFVYYFISIANTDPTLLSSYATMVGFEDPSALVGFAVGQAANLEYLNQTLFLAFALMFPEVRFYIYFILPVKAKWLAYVYLGLMAWQIVQCIMRSDYYGVTLIVGALVNFAVFFIFARGSSSLTGSVKEKRRKNKYKKMQRPHEVSPDGSRHKCAICGCTEITNPEREFRYCSKCNGNYEYCSEHLFTHEHVR